MNKGILSHNRVVRNGLLLLVLLFAAACGGNSAGPEHFWPDELNDEVEYWRQALRDVGTGARPPFDLVDHALELGLNYRRAYMYYDFWNSGDTELLIPVYSRGMRVTVADAVEGQEADLIEAYAERYGLEIYKRAYNPELGRQTYWLEPPDYLDREFMANVGDLLISRNADRIALIDYYVAYNGHTQGHGDSF